MSELRKIIPLKLCGECIHKRYPGGGHCYMFREEPKGAYCGQFQIDPLSKYADKSSDIEGSS